MKIKKEKKGNFVLVIDVEACCWYGNPKPGMYKEIIEIGIACVDYYTKEIVETRSIIVKPKYSEISEFCTKLTSLTPEYINKHGVDFKVACEILVNEYNSNKRIWFSWGDSDKIMFEKECAFKKIKYPFGKTHVNLMELYSFKYGLKQSSSVSTALKQLGLEFEGQCHRGVDDAKMTAKILQKMIE